MKPQQRASFLLLAAIVTTFPAESVHAGGTGGTGGGLATTIVDLPSTIIKQTRRILNFNNIFGPSVPSQQQQSQQYPYDLVMGHPVFQVTTSYGSPYMNMEKITEYSKVGDDDNDGGSEILTSDVEDILSGKASISSDSNQYRAIALYYMDPDDVLAGHAEFKQMEQMTNIDIRITAVSLAKAIRSATHLGHGLVTGQKIDDRTGRLPSVKEGGSLRHKILPPKKQLYYATRCYGKERVGLFGSAYGADNSSQDRENAASAVLGNSALNYRNIQRRQLRRDRKFGYKPKNELEAQYQHMDGQLGIPVFYAHGMMKQYPIWKSLISGHRREVPLFFNYEDLERAWEKTRLVKSGSSRGGGGGGKSTLPQEPTVEVFNLWDILTSIDKEQYRKRQQSKRMPISKRALQYVLRPFKSRWIAIQSPTKTRLNIDAITFIPSSDACQYKESITARGNGKARLRPMR